MLKKMRVTLCLLFVYAMATVAAADEFPDWAIETLLAPWYAAYNARDAEALADMYTAVAHVGEVPEVVHNRAVFQADTLSVRRMTVRVPQVK